MKLFEKYWLKLRHKVYTIVSIHFLKLFVLKSKATSEKTILSLHVNIPGVMKVSQRQSFPAAQWKEYNEASRNDRQHEVDFQKKPMELQSRGRSARQQSQCCWYMVTLPGAYKETNIGVVIFLLGAVSSRGVQWNRFPIVSWVLASTVEFFLLLELLDTCDIFIIRAFVWWPDSKILWRRFTEEMVEPQFLESDV